MTLRQRAMLGVGIACACVMVAIGAGGVGAGARSEAPLHDGVLIFAAASLQTVMDDMAPGVERQLGVRVRTSYAASSVLARQIENGAPAEIFISADQAWMDYLAARRAIHLDSRVDLIGNELVLVAPAADRVTLVIGPGFPLAAALGRGRLAVADPTTVPAGRYARAALTALGVWDDVAPRVAAADNVRAALVLVARAETPFGIVYRTDAMVEPRVQVVGVFPEASHPPIVYPAALTAGASSDAARVLAYLRSPAATAVFHGHGFRKPR